MRIVDRHFIMLSHTARDQSAKQAGVLRDEMIFVGVRRRQNICWSVPCNVFKCLNVIMATFRRVHEDVC